MLEPSGTNNMVGDKDVAHTKFDKEIKIMRIQHNIMAMNAYRNLGTNNTGLSKNLEKLSSGYRINRAGDDAAGLAISEKMRAQISGLDQAQKNAQSGINLVKTAEGALTEVHDMLNRMVTLASQSANGTYEGTDRSKLQAEIDALVEEIDRIADNSNFNGTKLLDGSLDTTSTTKYSGDAATTAAGIDVSFSIGQYEKADGTKANITVSLSSTTTAASAGAVATSDGTVEITLCATKDYTADDIKDLLSKVSTTGFGTSAGATALATEITDAIKAATVSGAGVDGSADCEGIAETGAGDVTTASGTELTLQIGADAVETINVGVESMKASDLGISKLNISDVTSANDAIDTIKTAIEQVSVTRGNLGAIQNRLEHTINNLGVMEENIQDAEANIRDTDIADEMMAYTKNNILIQSAQAMLAQANQVPQGVLQLMQ